MKKGASFVALASALAGCGTFIALDDHYTRRCDELTTVWEDADGDGDGNPSASITICAEEPVEGYVTNDRDCDDRDFQTSSRALDDECDGLDQDCDGTPDDGFSPTDCPPDDPANECLGRTECAKGATELYCRPRWFVDADGDGHGGEEVVGKPVACPAPHSGHAGFPDDCDDNDATVAPLEFEEEKPPFTERCDNVVSLTDTDCDGAPGFVFLGTNFTGVTLSSSDDAGAWWSPANSGWAIRPASPVCNGPTTDTTPNSADGNVLGLGAVAACFPPGSGGQVFSPTVDTSKATRLYLDFQRFLVFVPDPSGKKQPPSLAIWIRQGSVLSFVKSYSTSTALDADNHNGWVRDVIDVTAYRSAATALVFTYELGDDPSAGPSIDDVRLTDDRCEMP